MFPKPVVQTAYWQNCCTKYYTSYANLKLFNTSIKGGELPWEPWSHQNQILFLGLMNHLYYKPRCPSGPPQSVCERLVIVWPASVHTFELTTLTITHDLDKISSNYCTCLRPAEPIIPKIMLGDAHLAQAYSKAVDIHNRSICSWMMHWWVEKWHLDR